MNVIDSFRLDGAVAIVTGANRGLGLASARAIAQAGGDVGLLGRDLEKLSRVAEQIERETGRSTACAQADVTRQTDVEGAIRHVSDALGTPTILVNNAGIERPGRLDELEPDDWEAVLATNLGGLFACSSAFLRSVGEDGATIINVASIGAAAGIASQSAYCASKGGVVSATRALAVELARRGVRVNAIAPGYFATDMPEAVFGDDELRTAVLRRVPLRRFAEPSEIGPLVVYLAGRASAFMTGATLYLDGGYTAQ